MNETNVRYGLDISWKYNGYMDVWLHGYVMAIWIYYIQYLTFYE